MEYRALTLHYRTFLWITTIEAILAEAGRIESTQIQKNFHITTHFLSHYKELPLLQQRANGWKRSEHPNLPVHCQQSLITTLLPFFITYNQLFLHFKLRNQKVTYPSMKWQKLASCNTFWLWPSTLLLHSHVYLPSSRVFYPFPIHRRSSTFTSKYKLGAGLDPFFCQWMAGRPCLQGANFCSGFTIQIHFQKLHAHL